MSRVFQKKLLRKIKTNSVTEEINVIELIDLEPNVSLSNETSKIDENRTLSRQRESKNWTMEVEPEVRTTNENTTDKPAGSGKAVQIPVVEKKRTLMAKLEHMVISAFDDKLGDKLPSGYLEPSVEVDEVSSFSLQDFCRPSSFRDCTTDAKYDRADPFLCAFLVS